MVSRGLNSPQRNGSPFVACHLHIITFNPPPGAPQSPINMTDTIHSFLVAPVLQGRLLDKAIHLNTQVKVTPHFTLDTSTNTSESAPSPGVWPITRQIQKNPIIMASKYKVQITTKFVKKEERLCMKSPTSEV